MVEKEKVISNEFKLLEKLFQNQAQMIRWFLLRFLGCVDVMRFTSVQKFIHNFMFCQGDFKKAKFDHFIKQHFKPQKIPAFIYQSQMANFDRPVYSRILQKHFYLPRLQEAINTEFKECMEAMDIDDKPLSLIKLIMANLIEFTVPEGTRFVVGEEDE